jgi:hypothetical protein
MMLMLIWARGVSLPKCLTDSMACRILTVHVDPEPAPFLTPQIPNFAGARVGGGPSGPSDVNQDQRDVHKR